MAKVTGIGGVFFKSANKSSELAAWYQKNLGLDLESWSGALDLLQRDRVRSYLGSGAGKGRRYRPNLRGRTYGSVYG